MINKRKMHITVNLPDNTPISVWVKEGESMKEAVDRTINSWYFSHHQINPDWYKNPVVVGECPKCHQQLIVRKIKDNYVVNCLGYPECDYLAPANKEQIRLYEIKEFKIKVHEELIKRISGMDAYQAMKNYDSDFNEFFDKELSVVATATAIIMGY